MSGGRPMAKAPKGTAPKITPATPAWEAFRTGLRDLTDEGSATPCGDPRQSHLWTAEDAQARSLAVEGCRPCPLLTECHNAAQSTREAFGVWAGIDRTKT